MGWGELVSLDGKGKGGGRELVVPLEGKAPGHLSQRCGLILR